MSPLSRALALIASLLVPLPALAELAQPSSHVLVTFGGAITESNLPAYDENSGGVFAYMDISYKAGAGFDAGMLATMPAHEITIPLGPEENMNDITMSGPHLSDVLKMLGATGKSVTPVAMDGYQAEIPWDLINAHNPILATHGDGEPLPIGTYGPAMIVFPPSDDAETQETLVSKQVWAIIYVDVK